MCGGTEYTAVDTLPFGQVPEGKVVSGMAPSLTHSGSHSAQSSLPVGSFRVGHCSPQHSDYLEQKGSCGPTALPTRQGVSSNQLRKRLLSDLSVGLSGYSLFLFLFSFCYLAKMEFREQEITDPSDHIFELLCCLLQIIDDGFLGNPLKTDE